MKTPTTTFRLDKKVIKMMDGLITNPPDIVVDEKLGRPRNRTELVEMLVKNVYQQTVEMKKAAK